MDFFGRAYHMDAEKIPARVDEVLKYIDLDFKRTDFVRNLSRGMVQRLGVGALLMHDPALYLLDEPASGLDPKARIQLRNTLKKLSADGATVIISSHILTELSGFCTHVALMNRGKMVVYGSVDEIEQKMKGTRRVTVRVLADSDLAQTVIRDTPDTKVVDSKEDMVVFETTVDTETLAGINTRLVEAGLKVVHFHEEKSNLEDLFMQVSGGAGSFSFGEGDPADDVNEAGEVANV